MKAGFLLVVALFGATNVFGRIIQKKGLEDQLDGLLANLDNLEKDLENIVQQKDFSNPPKDENEIDVEAGETTDILKRPDEDEDRKRAANSDYWKWPKTNNGIVEILYDFTSAYAEGDPKRATIEDAVSDLNVKLANCIRFVKRRPDVDGNTHYARFGDASGCSSYVGRYTGYEVNDLAVDYQPVNLKYNGCVYKGIIQHELIHLMGVFHEQSRPDRDQYVTINWENIWSGMEGNFKIHTSAQTFNHPYDYNSVMHYGRKGFSTNGKDTITPIDPSIFIGQRDGISDGDVLDIKSYYQCSDPTTTDTTTTTPTTTTTTTTARPSTAESTTSSTESTSTTQSTPSTPSTTPSTPSTTQSTPSTTQSTPSTRSTRRSTRSTTTEEPDSTTEEPYSTTEEPTTEPPVDAQMIASANFTKGERGVRKVNIRPTTDCKDKIPARWCGKLESDYGMGCDEYSNICPNYCQTCDAGDLYASARNPEQNASITLTYRFPRGEKCAEKTYCFMFDYQRNEKSKNPPLFEFYGYTKTTENYEGRHIIHEDVGLDGEWDYDFGDITLPCRTASFQISSEAGDGLNIDNIEIWNVSCSEVWADSPSKDVALRHRAKKNKIVKSK